MTTPIVPSVGPALSSGGGNLVNAGMKQTVNAAPAAPPTSTAPVQFQSSRAPRPAASAARGGGGLHR